MIARGIFLRRFALQCCLALASALMLGACPSSKPAPAAAPQDTLVSRIQAIPEANPALYRTMKSMKNWHNPYLILRKDAVGLLDVNDNEEKILKPEEVAAALAALPSLAWPYGRVVAVQQAADAASDQDKVKIRRIKGIVAGTLEELHVTINWVPAA